MLFVRSQSAECVSTILACKVTILLLLFPSTPVRSELELQGKRTPYLKYKCAVFLQK